MSTSEDKYKISWTNKFKKGYKLAIKRGKDTGKLDEIIRCLARDLELPASLCDYELKGKWKQHRGLHIEPDLLLIYQKKRRPPHPGAYQNRLPCRFSLRILPNKIPCFLWGSEIDD